MGPNTGGDVGDEVGVSAPWAPRARIWMEIGAADQLGTLTITILGRICLLPGAELRPTLTADPGAALDGSSLRALFATATVWATSEMTKLRPQGRTNLGVRSQDMRVDRTSKMASQPSHNGEGAGEESRDL